MPLINANEITITAIKETRNENQRADSIPTVAFINKITNDPIQPWIIKERIEQLIKNGTIFNKQFNGHRSFRLTEKDITSPEKKFKESR